LCLIGASGGVPANFTRVRLLGLTAIAGAQSQIVQKNTSAKMVLTMIDGPIAPPGGIPGRSGRYSLRNQHQET